MNLGLDNLNFDVKDIGCLEWNDDQANMAKIGSSTANAFDELAKQLEFEKTIPKGVKPSTFHNTCPTLSEASPKSPKKCAIEDNHIHAAVKKSTTK